MLTTIIAYVLLGLFVAVIERRARVGPEAKDLDKSSSDRGTTKLVGIAFFLTGLALLAAPALNYLQIGTLTLSPFVGWIGIVIAVSGIALRLWANKTLGAFYTRTLRVAATQHIVREGPYRLLRHPGYLGSILMWVGAALATTNWIAAFVAVVVMFIAYHFRIVSEEIMLLTAMGKEYREYQAHTWKLIPLIY